MVDYIRDETVPIPAASLESVLPATPAQTEALAARALQRLYLRRWLVAICGLVLLAFIVFYQLPALPAAVGFAAIAAAAAFLPREGLFPVRPKPRVMPGATATQLFVTLLDGLPAPAILLTASGQVWGYNVQAREFLPNLRTGEHISTAIRDPQLLEAVDGARIASRSRQSIVVEERVPIERHIEVTLSFIGTEREIAPRTPAILLFLRDLTMQERHDRLRSEFIANASHELRTPLAALKGFIETLQGAAKDDAKVRERFLGIMAKQAERMAELIDNLLSLSRVEMRQHLRPQTRIDLRDVIRQASAAIEPIARKAGIIPQFEGFDAPAIVLAEQSELVQVLYNLIHNAIKYGRGGGNVWVSLSRVAENDAARLAISVRDDGSGIAAEHLPRLTERFYRANGNGGEAAGTGLGLAIVKHVVARHRGDLRISSEVGAGSTFTVLLDEAKG